MTLSQNTNSKIIAGPSALGSNDVGNAWFRRRCELDMSSVRVGTVEQFNVGLYSALVSDGVRRYVCLIGAQNVTPGFGYSDMTLLREGDEVIFATPRYLSGAGLILARKPTLCVNNSNSTEKVESDNKQTRRSSFYGNDGYLPKSAAYSEAPKNEHDMTVRGFSAYRPADMVPGECGTLNQHRCGLLGGMYSMSIVGGGAHIRLFSLENRIRAVAESMVVSTLYGNDNAWHNRRYLSHESTGCLYQEERMGIRQKEQPPFGASDYFDDGYYTKNVAPRQTMIPRILKHEGYYGGLSTRYCLQPDQNPDGESPARSMNDRPKDPGVMRESVDPSGQYRLATTGMLGFERIGRIPVPHRTNYPWQKEAKDPEASALKPFEHDEDHPYYRQLELADRVAYDLKNSYARLDEATSEFYTPEENDLEDKLQDVYDRGFTDSTTVKLKKYDKRRSGIWQGEDGSIILRDAWGSEIVMIGGNIQISCAGNVETLPGKTALTMAGDDIVHKAQNSIDIESADKDVRINGYKNVQILGGNEKEPGGVTIEAKGKASPWDGKSPDGGEQIQSTGILLKSAEGSVVTDTKNLILRGKKWTSLISGEENLDGNIFISGGNVYTRGKSVISMTGTSAFLLSGTAALVGDSAILAGTSSAAVFAGEDYLVPLMTVEVGPIAEEVLSALTPLVNTMQDESKVAMGYSTEYLDKMIFKFRSSDECGTTSSWELSGSGDFTLYEPFWAQIATKFETLKNAGVSTKDFEDHKDNWGNDVGHPWPGTGAIGSAKYAKTGSGGPANLTDDGLNKPRSEVVDSTSVEETSLFPGYKIREN